MSTDRNHTYLIDGMSCGHCEAAVRGELEKVVGVQAVEIDMSSKQVVVRGLFEDADVRAAIADAGYEAA